MLESLLAAATAVACALSATLEAVTPEAKKPRGYINVTVFSAERAPPALEVNAKVTCTSVLFTTRSLLTIINWAFVTALPIDPEKEVRGGSVSVLVNTLTEPPAVGVSPKVTPLIVTMTAMFASTVPD